MGSRSAAGRVAVLFVIALLCAVISTWLAVIKAPALVVALPYIVAGICAVVVARSYAPPGDSTPSAEPGERLTRLQRLEVWNDAATDFRAHLAVWLFGAISLVLGFASGVLALSGYPFAAIAVGWALVAGVLMAWTLYREHMRRSLRAASTAEDATAYFAVFDRRVRATLLVVAIVWTVLMLCEAALL